ncbi:hypothetical protein [Microvirga sp. CF3016]|uniref:hypothetical protein n=1 Tax=Microvirga sp. CF3016 TaxID=3110181 RepID=UPI002E79DE42|nr:hypothetical protein [Microvirga sp. CF3016]MEE1612073.1 hypothetical protein [Microvirga sp. CF3016]
MSHSKRPVQEISDEEEAAIQAQIAEDPDNPEWSKEDYARARPAHELLPSEVYASRTKGEASATAQNDIGPDDTSA